MCERGGKHNMQNALVIIHVIISVVLIAVVLLQHGKQQGLSGSIAGGAETFFGKNKGRTIDAMLKKFTSVFAALFIISSVALALVTVGEQKKLDAELQQTQQNAEAPVPGETTPATVDEEGNVLDADGNVVMTSEQVQAELAKQAEEAETAETENAEAETETAETAE